MAKFYDPKCLELAKHFYRHAPEDVLDKMAQAFQDIAEDYTDHKLESGETLQEREDRMMFGPREGESSALTSQAEERHRMVQAQRLK